MFKCSRRHWCQYKIVNTCSLHRTESSCFSIIKPNYFGEKHWLARHLSKIFLENLNTFVSKLYGYFPSLNHSEVFNCWRSLFELSALEVHSEMNWIAQQLVELQSRQMWRENSKILNSNKLNFFDLQKEATKAVFRGHINVQQWWWSSSRILIVMRK